MKKTTIKRLVTACLILALVVAGFAFRTNSSEAADDLTEKWIDVDFTKPMRIKWNWDDLMTDAVTAERNMNLSVAGLVMSQAAELSRAKVEALLGRLGFSDMSSDYYLLSTDTKNDISQPARTFGHKLLVKDGIQYHVICAIFKGTTTFDDVITDGKAATDGFKKAGENCKASLAEYVKKIDGATKENTIMFITGHSLGASTANVVGLLCDDLVADGSKFVYTYASPNYKTNAAGAEKAADAYNNFIRFTNADDLVPLVPPTNIIKHFNHVGRNVYYNLAGLDSETKEKFDRVYKYMKGKTFEEDTLKIKDHMGDTYMSFILSEKLTNDQITEYLTPTATPTPAATSTPVATATSVPTVSPVPTTEPTASPAPTDDPGTVTPPAEELKANPIKVTGKTAKAKSTKKTTLKVGKVLKVKKAQGKISYKKKSGNKKISINKKSGKVIIKKGLKKGKTYKVKVVVSAAGNDKYKPGKVTAVFKIKIS